MAAGQRILIPASIATMLLVVLLPPPASADIVTSLTTHTTSDGPATTTIGSCSFYVRAEGLLAETGTIRVWAGAQEVGSAPWTAYRNGGGLFDATVGPITLTSSHSGLVARTSYADATYWALTTAPFNVQCSPPPACVVTWILGPIGVPGHQADPGQVFKFGQDIPAKASVSCPGAHPPPRIFIAKANGNTLDAEQPGTTRIPANANVMNMNGNHWHYNLDTRPLALGLWQLRVDVGDGTDHVEWVNLT